MTMLLTKHETVNLETLDDGAIAIIRMNRPGAMNALNMQLADDFITVLDKLAAQNGLRAVVVAGNGKAFCAGGDLAAFKASHNPAQFLTGLATRFHESIKRIRTMDAPLVAAIHGPCMGVGLSLACACDFRIAAEGAKFSVAFTGVGLSPDSSLPFFLPRIVGQAMATELAFLNPVIDAKRALELNLVSAVTAGDVVKEATDLARKLASMPTKALGAVKRLYDSAFSDSLETHLAKEALSVGETAATADFKEGCAAFFEKRKPNFKGN
jgi:2-(1,2-epoxy-1,2-dihydrophenyl)acetyl-CoA isomerase